MEYIISLSTQTRGFLLSLGLGTLVGALYDVIRIVRIFFSRSGLSVLVSDVLFVLSAAALTFLFCLTAAEGEVRLYIIAGELLGFLIYYFSFGVIAVRFTEKTADRIRTFFAKVFGFIFSPVKRLFHHFAKKSDSFLKFFRKMSKKIDKNAKLHLQKDKVLLYNLMDKMHNCRKKSSEFESDENYGR